MKKLLVNGGRRLVGEVHISGSKNASLPILMSSILIAGESKLTNIPAVSDVLVAIQLLKHLGAVVEFDQKNNSSDNCLRIDSGPVNILEAPYEIVSKMRASFWVLGSLLGRFGKAKVSLPGGCSIGPRPCDIYLDVLDKMGVDLEVINGYVEAQVNTSGGKLKGADITLRLPSVGATHNTIMAACLAEGTTIIRNAAKEPEVVDLCQYLLKAGAHIKGFGSNIIEIEGVGKLHSSSHRVIGDRVEAFSYMVAAAITKGNLLLEGYNCWSIFAKPLEVLQNINLLLKPISSNQMRITVGNELKPLNITTGVYPEFPTDMQPMIMALLALAKGQSRIRETIFENRFMQAPELNRLGANITTSGNEAIIDGISSYCGTHVVASDIRAGMSLILAALQATGQTIITEVHHVERGYENFVGKLQSCGADIKLMDDE
jgi:UDP-N-acetylglucosamine 1-carboxyvinyltransferase